MPSHRVHRALERPLFGRTFEEVHRIKDEPAQWVPGTKHRRLRHDPISNAVIAAQLGDPIAFLAGEYHDMVDEIISSMPKPARQVLEALVK